jgi:hypothetical protein
VRPTVAPADALDVLRRVDAGKIRARVVSDVRGLRTYRVEVGWLVAVWTRDGAWWAIERLTTPDGVRHDPWHYVYDPDHRVDAPFYAEVRAFRPTSPRRWGLTARAARPQKRRGPRYTKSGKRAFL